MQSTAMMSRAALLLVLSLAAGAPARGPQDQPPEEIAEQPFSDIIEKPVHRSTTLRIRGSGWFSSAAGSLRAGDDVEGFPDAIRLLDLEDTLNLDTDEVVVWGQASLHFGGDGRWMIGGGYSGPFSYSGRTDPIEIVFREHVYEGEVASDARFHIYEINTGYDIIRGDRHSVMLGLSTRLFDIEASLEGAATDPDTNSVELRRESADALVPIPGPALALRIDATERLFIRGRASGIYLGSYGHFVDASAELGFDLTANLGIFGGYRYIRAEADVSDVEFDLTIDGFYAGAEVRF